VLDDLGRLVWCLSQPHGRCVEAEVHWALAALLRASYPHALSEGDVGLGEGAAVTSPLASVVGLRLCSISTLNFCTT
jgi:hypothetical protein